MDGPDTTSRGENDPWTRSQELSASLCTMMVFAGHTQCDFASTQPQPPSGQPASNCWNTWSTWLAWQTRWRGVEQLLADCLDAGSGCIPANSHPVRPQYIKCYTQESLPATDTSCRMRCVEDCRCNHVTSSVRSWWQPCECSSIVVWLRSAEAAMMTAAAPTCKSKNSFVSYSCLLNNAQTTKHVNNVMSCCCKHWNCG